SSVTPKVARARSSSSSTGSVIAVGRENADRARSRRRSQSFARAYAEASGASAAASALRARNRSRSVGALSRSHVSAASGRFVVGDERRPGSAARQAALLEAEQEDDLGASGARAQEVGHRHTARLVTPREPQLRPLEPAVDLLARKAAAELRPLLQLAEDRRD